MTQGHPPKSSGARQSKATKPVRKSTKEETSPPHRNGSGSDRSRRAAANSDTEIPPWIHRTIALFFMWVVALLVGYWALNRLRPLLLMLVVALFLSLALEPPVNKLTQRGWRRGTATGVVAVTLIVAVLGFLFAFGSVAVTQASELINNAPHYTRQIVGFLNDDFGLHINAQSLIRELQSKDGAVHQFGKNLAQSAPDVGLAVAKGLFQLIVMFVFAFYLIADGPRFRRVLCSRLSRARQEVMLDTWDLAIDKTGSYLYSRSIQAIICAAVVWGFLTLLGVPSALALAIWVGVVSQFIPTVGTYIALVLPVLVTLVNSPVDTIWVLVFLVGYQQFENYLLGPRIARYTLHIHPAVTIGTVLAGALLFGPVGALLALPAAAVTQALLTTYTEKHEVIETDLTVEPATPGKGSTRKFRRLRQRPA